MFYITEPDERPDGWVNLSDASQWIRWLNHNIPDDLDNEVRRRLSSNLRHLIVGLELKTALILPHAWRNQNQRAVLFESYFQNLILEFCVATFSVVEGLGAAHWLSQSGYDGADGRRIGRSDWRPALCDVYDQTGEHGLNDAIERTLSVRDKLHQDKIGARMDIDWHALSYEAAFVPASRVICTLLRKGAELVPERSNLQIELV
ncbi:hypothetical protein [Sphingosinicella xenopeptidilytica]|jgi:hypothetical protein|uniref:Uncharacterized protein n=1 Tax=Sphingosinicella xenopeptidilytica TaxID=364098 RepID=A0ABW3C7Y8_SPHXN